MHGFVTTGKTTGNADSDACIYLKPENRAFTRVFWQEGFMVPPTSVTRHSRSFFSSAYNM
uniref:Uncharacterized protein n=1 Tax=Arundo donax TaxID=35708 RepID=A0A0A9D171_ARUDO